MDYLQNVPIDRELVLDFFLRFSRFEFALKITGYACGDDARVDPDWNRFAADIRSTLKAGIGESSIGLEYRSPGRI
jgi:hypothetical protein